MGYGYDIMINFDLIMSLQTIKREYIKGYRFKIKLSKTFKSII